jgi:HD superfamily phosphodiesterase
LNEAKILSDAQNLDDMGIVGIFSLLRNSSLRGKGPSDVLRSWKKKIDYGYFQARLKESFHFESVKRIAKKRFELTENFMSRLQDECSAKDILDAVENMFSRT